MGFLGDRARASPRSPINRIGDLAPGPAATPPSVSRIVVLIAWSAVALGLGAWRTKTREI